MPLPSAMPTLDAPMRLSQKVLAIVRELVMPKDIPGLIILSAGVIGAAITLFANLLAPLDMVDWAWWLVGNWQEIAPAFWDRIAAWFGLEVPNLLIPPLNLAASLLLISIGVRVRDQHRDAATLRIGFYHVVGGSAALLAIGYIVAAGPASSTTAGEIPPEAPLTIFLAAAAASFSPVFAGRGNLFRRLWYVLAGVCVLVALNALTKVAGAS